MTAKALKWRSALLQWFGVEKRSQRCHRALSYETSELLGLCGFMMVHYILWPWLRNLDQFRVRFCDVFAALCGFEWLLPQIFQVAQANSRLHPSWVSSQYLWVSTANLSNVAKQHIQHTHKRPLIDVLNSVRTCMDMLDMLDQFGAVCISIYIII